MSTKKISKSVFSKLVDAVVSSEKVYGVKAVRDEFNFGQIGSSGELRLDYDLSLQSPKKYFLPPAETIVSFDRSEGYQSVYETEKFVVLGVHPYDMIALNQMDEIFSQDNYDNHYMTRRKNATIVACDVVKASKNVFASSMNTATVSSGYDVLLTDIGDSYVVEIATEKGEALMAKAGKLDDADKAAIDARQKVWENNKKGLNKHELDYHPSYLPKLLEKAYDHPVWEELAKTCFACGSCNTVCPTCYCFNVQDDVNWDMNTGERKRCWDGCLLDGFTKVAPNHEFRKKKADRIRHRLYRKGKYVPAKIGGQIACVGCGRCVGACLPDIANPVKIYNRLISDLGIG